MQIGLGLRLLAYVRSERAQGRVNSLNMNEDSSYAVAFPDLKSSIWPFSDSYEEVLHRGFLCVQVPPIDPYNKGSTRPSACHGVPMGGMG